MGIDCRVNATPVSRVLSDDQIEEIYKMCTPSSKPPPISVIRERSRNSC